VRLGGAAIIGQRPQQRISIGHVPTCAEWAGVVAAYIVAGRDCRLEVRVGVCAVSMAVARHDAVDDSDSRKADLVWKRPVAVEDAEPISLNGNVLKRNVGPSVAVVVYAHAVPAERRTSDSQQALVRYAATLVAAQRAIGQGHCAAIENAATGSDQRRGVLQCYAV